MKKSLLILLIILDILIILFIPMVPAEFIGGMMTDGNVYTKTYNATLSETFFSYINDFTADASSHYNLLVFILELLVLIIINIVIYRLLIKLNKK